METVKKGNYKMIEPYDPNLDKFDDVFHLFESKEYRNKVSEVNKVWLSNVKQWNTFTTLTFERQVSEEFAIRVLMGFIAELNRIKFGNHYTRKVGHSYFSYVVGVEKQHNGNTHFHMITDDRLDYGEMIHYWHNRAGYAYIEPIKNPEQTIIYVTKYALKGGESIIYLKPSR